MSAYIVDKNHIDYLIAAALSHIGGQGSGSHRFRWWHDGQSHTLTDLGPDNRQEVGQMLWDENVKSVFYRYPDDGPDTAPGPGLETYLYQATDACWDTMKPAQVLKACDCYEYQSCEHPEWKGSSAKAFIDGLRRAAWHCVAGYDAAEWGAPEPNPNAVSLTSLIMRNRRTGALVAQEATP